MPFIFCDQATQTTESSSTLERFHSIIEKYKSILENNATARCMIGFTAASFIRNEGDIDVDLLESWLQSLEIDDDSREEFDQRNTQVERILNVVMNSTTEYTSDEYDTEEEEDSGTNNVIEEDEDGFEVENGEVYELNRFISRGPYSPLGSYPIYTYHPRVSLVKQSDDNLIHTTGSSLHSDSF